MQAAITPLSSYTYYYIPSKVTNWEVILSKLVMTMKSCMQAEYMHRTGLIDDLAQNLIMAKTRSAA